MSSDTDKFSQTSLIRYIDDKRHDLESRTARLEQDVAGLKEKTSFYKEYYERFDSTLDKLEEMVEDRRSATHNDLKDVYSKIEDVEKKIMSEIERMRSDMKEQHRIENKKIDELNRWRWIVMGGAAVVGWVISKLDIISGGH